MILAFVHGAVDHEAVDLGADHELADDAAGVGLVFGHQFAGIAFAMNLELEISWV